MATPFIYMATVIPSTPPYKSKENIWLFAFTAGIDYSSWDSQSIADGADLTGWAKGVPDKHMITLAVPFAQVEEDFKLGSRFEFLKLFATRKSAEDYWNSSATAEVKGHLNVEGHGKFPQNTSVPRWTPNQYQRLRADGKDSSWEIPQFVRISVRP